MSGLFEEIKTRSEEFAKEYNAGNITAVAAFYAPDATLMQSGKEPIKGRSAIEAALKEGVESGMKSVQGTTEEVNGSGEWAFERGSFSAEGASGTISGAYLVVWKKVDEKWLIYSDCSTVIKPAPH